MALQFSGTGKYFAQLSSGKLKIWNTISNTLEQEYTPDFHLTTPCTCLHFVEKEAANKGSPSPKKKKKKDDPNLNPNIILGTTSGLLLVYSISKADINITIDSQTSSNINCISTENGVTVYSGNDQSIFEWNLKKRVVRSKWKAGNETISAILKIPNSPTLITASKMIKVWDINSKEILKTYTGHSSEVTLLSYVNPGSGDLYILSGSKGDRIMSCWSLESEGQRNAISNYLLEDVIENVSVNITNEGLTTIAAAVRSGVVHLYQHKLNGKCEKPLKPKTTIQIASKTNQDDLMTRPIRIFGAVFRDEQTLCIGHGSEVILTFESVEISTVQKMLCLVREDPHSVKASKSNQINKTRVPLIGDNVHYLTPHTSGAGKRKNDGHLEVPMEQRLENLTLNELDSAVPRSNNVAQLLLQGLHSKDKTILKTAFCRKDENVIRNTVKRLPVIVFEPLVKELASLVHGKTILSHFGALWLKNFIQIHAGVLISNPNLSEMLVKTLTSIQSRASMQIPLSRLRGKLELLMPQISVPLEDEEEEQNDALLIFHDKDSESESEQEMQIDVADSDSEIENEWDEESIGEENHIKDSESDSDSIIMLASD